MMISGCSGPTLPRQVLCGLILHRPDQHRRRSGHNELLGRAVGVKAGESPRVVDATAGLGRDAYVLGDLGCEVTLVERSPVLALLLAHALERARISSVESVRAAAASMCLRQADSCSRGCRRAW